MQKHASKNGYRTVFGALPTSPEQILYYDIKAVELPYAEDFPRLHYHDRYEIGVCECGDSLLLCEGRFYSVTKGDVIFIPAGQHHYFRSLYDDALCKCRFAYVHTEPIEQGMHLDGMVRDVKVDNIPAILHFGEHPDLSDILSSIMKLCDADTPHRDNLIALKLATFIIEAQSRFYEQKLAEHKLTAVCTPAPAAARLAEYIALHYSESQSAAELAKMCFISESQLRRQFITAYGMPPIAYRNHLRAGIGAEMLVRTRLAVSEIAEQVGYSSASDFYRVFLKRYGVSPTDYRKNKSH